MGWVAGAASQLPGTPLSAEDLKRLAACGIPPELTSAAGIRRVDSAEGAELVGRRGGDYAGIVFPYAWPGENHIRDYRLRRDNPDVEYDHNGKRKERAKYLTPPGRGNMLYFPPGVAREQLTNTSLPIVIVEGEKKTLALSAVAWHDRGDAAEDPAFLAIGLSGVWNWRGTVGKESGPAGKRRDIKGAIPDMERISWNRRKVIILFDTNVESNDAVRTARHSLSAELTRRGAIVHWFSWPADTPLEANGIDDVVLAWGPARTLNLIEQAPAWTEAGATAETIDVRTLETMTVRPPQPLVEGFLHAGETISLIGKGKLGKSRLMLQLALCLDRGASFLQFPVRRRCRVLYIDAEMAPGAVRERLQRMHQDGERPENIHFLFRKPLAPGRSSVKPEIVSKRGLRALQGAIERTKADVLILDPWRYFVEGKENDPEITMKALDAVEELRRANSDLAVIIVHHLRKTQFAEGNVKLRVDPGAWVERAAGSYALVAHTDATWGLEREKQEGGDEVIVLGGITRAYPATQVILDEDADTLLFNPVSADSALDLLLTPREKQLWAEIQKRSGFRFRELARATGTPMATVASAVRKLRQAGAITKTVEGSYVTQKG